MAVRLGLGTVQFGLNYGLSNTSGQPSEEEVKQILTCASAGGIDVIDTAAAYGESESVLGRCFASETFRIVTKTKPLREWAGGSVAGWIRDGVAQSLQRLRTESVTGLLVHHAADLLGPSGDAIYAELVKLKNEGMVEQIGLSAYSGADIDTTLDRYDIDLIQVPVNVFDQRLLQGGQLERLRRRQVDVHARSVFLQGLLLMTPALVPKFFDPIRHNLQLWWDALKAHALTPSQGAMAFVRSLDVDVALLGVDRAHQLEENQRDFAYQHPSSIDFTQFAVNEEAFLNPYCWKLET